MFLVKKCVQSLCFNKEWNKGQEKSSVSAFVCKGVKYIHPFMAYLQFCGMKKQMIFLKKKNRFV